MDSTEDRSAQPPPLPLAGESLRWPELTTTSRYVRRTGWELRSVPEELSQTPEETTVPAKLHQILTWSLIPGTGWASPPAPIRRSSRVKSHVSNNSEVSETKRQSQASTNNASIESRPLDNADNKSISSFQTSHSGPPSDDSLHSAETEKSLKSKLLAKIKMHGRFSDRKLSTIIKSRPPTAECTSCFEELPEKDMTRLESCRHWYCRDCLVILITTAMSTETSFPPKCCLSPIPLHQVLKALNANQRESYQQKAAEYAVPASDRWYCPDTNCLKWIPPNQLKINMELGYSCPHCSAKLCRMCRGSAHPANTECPQDFGLEATLETADVEGWQRCWKCRALVEHSTGCRHMTCTCKAEFCYVCGLQWHTCWCTETDASNKRADIEKRRQERQTRRDEEAAELARIIAEVEEMERREAEERRLEEEKQREAEEELLVQLENMRIEEELRKQEAAEQAERDFRKALVMSFEEEWSQIQDLYEKIMTYQINAINSRHQTEDNRLGQMGAGYLEEADAQFAADNAMLERNSRKRRSVLAAKQKIELEALEARQEEEEDDIFMQVQMRLRGKANKESRMEKMLNEMRKQQEEEKKEIEDKNKTESEGLAQKIKVDFDGLKKGHEAKAQETMERHAILLQKFGYTAGADRQYLEIVMERRRKMLVQHGLKALASIEAGEEPIGLTEYDASLIEPFLPGTDDDQQESSAISRSSVFKTPRDSMRLNSVPELTVSRISHDPREEKIVVTGPEIQEMYSGQSSPQWPQTPPVRTSGSFYADGFPGKHTATTTPATSPHAYQAEVPQSPVISRRPLPSAASPASNKPSTSDPTKALSEAAAASLSADLASAVAAQQTLTARQDVKTPVPSVTSIEPDVMYDHRRDSNSSAPAKKSKWGFGRKKEMSEQEMRRQLRAAVGDAF